jgi:hypothetical protein
MLTPIEKQFLHEAIDVACDQKNMPALFAITAAMIDLLSVAPRDRQHHYDRIHAIVQQMRHEFRVAHSR